MVSDIRVVNQDLKCVKKPEGVDEVLDIELDEKGLCARVFSGLVLSRIDAGPKDNVDFLFKNDTVEIFLTSKYYFSYVKINGVVIGCRSIFVYKNIDTKKFEFDISGFVGSYAFDDNK